MNSSPAIELLRKQIASLPPDALEIKGFRPAAVVVPLLYASEGWEILFTVRSKQLANHAGQIAFPGGKVDQGETLEQAAIRELHEEVGLEVSRILGRLHAHPSPAKFVVTPVVAILNWPQDFNINRDEVDEVFTVPLRSLASITPRTETRTIEQVTRTIRFYEYQHRMIWGLTGNIVSDLLHMFSEKPPSIMANPN